MFRRLHKFQAERDVVPHVVDEETSVIAPVDSTVQPVASTTACPPTLQRTAHPMSELWHSMQLLSQVETNTEGITRVRSSLWSYYESVVVVVFAVSKIKLLKL